MRYKLLNEDAYTDRIFVTPLYRLRKKAGLTQAELAKKTGLLKTQISKYERGAASSANMQLGTAAKLAKALGCHAEELLEKEESE